MSNIKMPSSYELIESEELMQYNGEGPTLTIALYTIASYVVVNWEMITTVVDLVDNANTIIGQINTWKQNNGKYKLMGQFVAGGTSNVYPPHSYQGATGYWSYYPVWVSN